MVTRQVTIETVEYIIVLVKSGSRKVLALDSTRSRRLLRMNIPQGTRPAEQLQKAVRTTWNLCVLVLDLLPARIYSRGIAVAEILSPDRISELKAVTLDEIGAF